MASVSFPIPHDPAFNMQARSESGLGCYQTRWQIALVPGQRHPDKTTLSVYLPRALMQRLRRLAATRKETVTSVIEGMVIAQTRDVELEPEDHEQIARESRQALKRRSSRKKG